MRAGAVLKDCDRDDVDALAAIPQHIGFAALGEMRNPVTGPFAPGPLSEDTAQAQVNFMTTTILRANYTTTYGYPRGLSAFGSSIRPASANY